VMALSGASPASAARSQDGDSGTRSTARGSQLRLRLRGIVIAALARYNPFAVCLVAILLVESRTPGTRCRASIFPPARRRHAGLDPLLRARR